MQAARIWFAPIWVRARRRYRSQASEARPREIEFVTIRSTGILTPHKVAILPVNQYADNRLS